MNNLQAFRKQAQLSQAALAKRAGCARHAVYLYERGRRPRLDIAQRIAGILDSTVEAVFPMEGNRDGT